MDPLQQGFVDKPLGSAAAPPPTPAGFVDKPLGQPQNPPAPAPTTGAPNTPPPPPPPDKKGGFWQKLMHPETTGATANLTGEMPSHEELERGAAKEGTVTRGMQKGLVETMGGTSKLLGGPGATNTETETHGGAEWFGNALETVMEFMAGDEALKALAPAAKVKELHGITQFMEKFPRLAKALETGIRQGAVGTAQSLAKGSDLSTALTSGAVTGVTGGAVEGGASLLKKSAAGEVERVAATDAHGRAAKELEAATAEHATAKEGAAEARETATQARGAVKTATASGKEAAAKAEADRLAAGQQTARAAVKKAAGQVSEGAGSFGDAAEALREEARPTFEKINEASGGQFNDLQRARRAAFRAKDFTKVEEINGQIDKLMEGRMGQLDSKMLDDARLTWRNSKVLDDVHQAVESSFSVPEAVSERTGQSRDLAGKALRGKLNRLLLSQGDDVERVLGKDGIDNLYHIAELTSPQKAKLTQDAAEQIAKALAEQEKATAASAAAKQTVKATGERAASAKAGLTQAEEKLSSVTPEKKHAPVIGLVQHAVSGRAGTGAMVGTGIGLAVGHPYAGALAGVMAGEGWQRVIHAAAINPRVGTMLRYAIDKGVNPSVYAPLIANEIRKATGSKVQ